jgi:hypothetical protein
MVFRWRSYTVSEDSDSKQVELDGFGDRKNKYRRTCSMASHCLDNLQAASSFNGTPCQAVSGHTVAVADTLSLFF